MPLRLLLIVALLSVSLSFAGPARADELVPEGEGLQAWIASDAVNFYGSIELEIRDEEGFADLEEDSATSSNTSTQDLSLDLGLEMRPSSWLEAMLEISWDEGSSIKLDKAWISLGNTENFPVYGAGGRATLPFGLFESAMLSDPLTQDVGEIKSEALLLGLEWNGWQATVFSYVGTTGKHDDGNELRSYGGSLAYQFEIGELEFLLGGSLISNLEDSEGLSDFIAEEDFILEDKIPGAATFALLTYGPFTFGGEYIESTKRPEFVDEESATKSDPQAAWTAEVAVALEISNFDLLLGLTYGKTKGLGDMLPKKRVGAAVTLYPVEYVKLGLEYLQEHDYSIQAGGSGDQADILTFQLALEF